MPVDALVLAPITARGYGLYDFMAAGWDGVGARFVGCLD